MTNHATQRSAPSPRVPPPWIPLSAADSAMVAWARGEISAAESVREVRSEVVQACKTVESIRKHK